MTRRLLYTLRPSDQEELLKSKQSLSCNVNNNNIRSDALQIGDYIQAINGIATDRLTQREVLSLLNSAGTIINLEVSFEVPADYGRCLCLYMCVPHLLDLFVPIVVLSICMITGQLL